jgi:acyl-CoA synthetase (NDP forming)
VLACFMGQAQVAEGVAVLRAAQIPQYNSPERAVDALVKMETPRPPGTAPSQPEGQPEIKFPISEKRAP